MSAFADADSVPPLRIWEGVSGRGIDSERITLALIELEADAEVPEHRHDNEQVGVLLRGSLSFRIGEERRELDVGGMWRIGAGLPHSVAAGPQGALVVEAFSPARSDWESLTREPPAPVRWR